MAKLVGGIGTSHTPQISMGVDNWGDHVRSWDMHLEGYDEVSLNPPEWLLGELAPERQLERYETCQANIGRLRDELVRLDPDVVVVFGDDQRELFRDDGSPTIALYCGDEIWDLPSDRKFSEARQAAEWAFHGTEPAVVRTAGALGMHLATSLTSHDLSLSVLRSQPEGRSLGHAFSFVVHRLANHPRWSMLPIWLNTYYPPNQISATAAYNLGKRVRESLELWDGAEKVAVVASGGLSHFFIDTELDQAVLSAIEKDDTDFLLSLSLSQLQSGTSEILNWVAAAGCMQGFNVTWRDYVPAYRSLAQTGVGVGALIWSQVS